jgi:hypothetical protein
LITSYLKKSFLISITQTELMFARLLLLSFTTAKFCLSTTKDMALEATKPGNVVWSSSVKELDLGWYPLDGMYPHILLCHRFFPLEMDS